ncbi:STAS domain-containing protein [Deltaproteobacteria bacterium TL4]
MHFSIKKEGQVHILTFKGEFTASVVGVMKDEIDLILNDRPCPLILNFKKITFMDSAGIGLLAYIIQRNVKYNDPLGICELDARKTDLLDKTGLNKCMQVYATEEEALAKISSSI